MVEGLIRRRRWLRIMGGLATLGCGRWWLGMARKKIRCVRGVLQMETR